MIVIRYDWDADSLRTVLGRVAEALRPDENDMLEIGSLAAQRIVTRTIKGLDYQDRPFVPYSKQYALKRAKSGRLVGKVELAYTGDMLRDLEVRTVQRRGEYSALLTFGTQRGRLLSSVHNQGRGRNPRRRFLDVAQGSRLQRELEEQLAALLDDKIEAAIEDATAVQGRVTRLLASRARNRLLAQISERRDIRGF